MAVFQPKMIVSSPQDILIVSATSDSAVLFVPDVDVGGTPEKPIILPAYFLLDAAQQPCRIMLGSDRVAGYALEGLKLYDAGLDIIWALAKRGGRSAAGNAVFAKIGTTVNARGDLMLQSSIGLFRLVQGNYTSFEKAFKPNNFGRPDLYYYAISNWARSSSDEVVRLAVMLAERASRAAD